jgi:hypothetical protein
VTASEVSTAGGVSITPGYAATRRKAT